MNVDKIQQAFEQFSWENLFRNLNIIEMDSLFNKTIKIILSNYIPHKAIICDDKGQVINWREKQCIKKLHFKQ